MKILHLADLHLGKLLFDVHLTEDQRHVLDQAKSIVKERGVEVVAISGDVYDRAIAPVEATALLDDFLVDLVSAGKTTVVVIPGNHDGAERLAFARRLLGGKNVHIASGKSVIEPVVIPDAHGPVTFYPVPFLTPYDLRESIEDVKIDSFTAVFQAMFDALPSPPSGRTVCLAHCYTAGGMKNDETEERALSIGGSEVTDPAVFRPFTLTLLGHLHRSQKVADGIWYAGSPLPYSFSDGAGAKTFSLFEVHADGKSTREEIPIKPLRGVRSIYGTIEEVLAAGKADPAKDDYLSVTLIDRGALFDAGRKIRAVYPNTLHILRRAEGGEGDGEVPEAAAARNRPDREVVSEFFRYVADELTADEQVVIDEILDGMIAAERKG
jgi:exonuclease SbcD